MTYRDILAHYTEVYLRLQAWENEHQEIFAPYREQEYELSLTETNLRLAVKKLGRGIENDTLSAFYTKATKRSFDWSIIEAIATPEELTIIKSEALKSVDVDANKLQELVLEGKIRPEIIQEAYTEQAMSPRISIKLK